MVSSPAAWLGLVWLGLTGVTALPLAGLAMLAGAGAAVAWAGADAVGALLTTLLPMVVLGGGGADGVGLAVPQAASINAGKSENLAKEVKFIIREIRVES